VDDVSGALGTWIDGVRGDAVPADDRGLQYGDGLFETILVRANRPRFLEAHLARLSNGLDRLAIPFAGFDALRAEIAAACAIAPQLAVLKIIVTRGSARRRGYPPADERPRRILSLWPAAALAEVEAGVVVRIAQLRIAEYSALAGLKHLNRLENVLAAAEEGSAFESLLLDTSGNVVSGVMSNVFVVESGRIATPPVDRAGVAGVMRGVVLREAPKLGIVAAERPLGLADLLAADEAFITNARLGVVPVRSVGEHDFGMNPISLRFRGHIEALDA
jgi:4-amino-4-deoxychorismate lyase